jgi:hypothetical protein
MAYQVIAIARGLEHLELFVDGASGKPIARTIIERDELCFAGIGNRHRGHEGIGRPTIPALPHTIAFRQANRIAGHQRIAAECFAAEKNGA